MNTIKKLMLLIGLGLVISAGAQAQVNITPESGWWLNPEVSGRGYNIEVQDNVVFIAAFTYDALETDGVRRPIWFQAAGTLKGVNGDNILEVELLLYEDGTCIGCSKTPVAIHTTEKHELRIEFHSDTTATMTIDGDSFPLKRFLFGTFENPHQKLLGQWSFVMTSPSSFSLSLSTPVSGDMLVFDEIEIDEDETYIWGCSVDKITIAYCSDDDKDDHWALATYDAELNRYIILVSENSQYYRGYVLDSSTNQLDGIVDQYLRTGGSFSSTRAQAARGFRSASRAFTVNGAGPAKATSRAKQAETNGRQQSMREQMILELKKMTTVK